MELNTPDVESVLTATRYQVGKKTKKGKVKKYVFLKSKSSRFRKHKKRKPVSSVQANKSMSC